MKRYILVFLLCICFSIASLNKIDEEILQDFDMKARNEADILILLNEQVNFNKISNKPLNKLSWNERGNIVLDSLMRLAQISQRPIINLLRENHISFRSYYVANMIFADKVPLNLIIKLSERSDVKVIQSNAPVDLDLESPDKDQRDAFMKKDEVEWNVKFINATYAWDKGYKGEGIILGNSDTGVDWTHPALKENYRGNTEDGVKHDYSWWDPTRSRSKEPTDSHGHGTHTIGTTAGGVDRKIGVSPKSKWIACRSIGSGTTAETFLSCLQFFLAPHDLNGKNPKPSLRPHSTGHSYGCRRGRRACKHEAWYKAIEALRATGQMIVASAGNAGSRCKTVRGPPGKLDKIVFTVGALKKNSHDITRFSSRGPAQETGKRKPDISASGENVVSSVPRGGYRAYSGTSMSCPAVNGVIGLMWSAFDELKGDIEKTQQILEETAKHQEDGQCDSKSESPNNVYGYGTVNVGKAFEAAKRILRRKH